ncbi:uncharacterized protein LOC133517425 [Cydia pomonella]|uniref:uncharacterized protein LOC133517425 n=1 Tax=Cydia pomonella TaxID=82600 RepID=UPI002ADDF5C8|nr:uncharacterized protein LOC133517425 [Cydia pomonella]
MDTYVSEQEITYDLIRKIGLNFKKQGKTRITKGYVQARIDTLNEYWQKFQTNHFEILKYATTAQKKEHNYFTTDLYSAGEEDYFTIKGDLSDTIELFNKSVISSEQPQPHPQNKSTSEVNKHSTQEVKLPKVSLPQFSGDYQEWTSFRDLYTSLVHNKTSLSKVQKLHYLKSSVTGEAEQLLKHLQITEKNYDVAWETLDKRYNNKRMIVNTILNRFMNQKKVYHSTSRSIRELLDTTQECLNSLKNNDVKINEWDTIVIHIILNKLDDETRKQWEEEIRALPVQELPKLEKFTTFLETRFRVLEMVPSTTYSKDRERAIVRQRSFLTSPATTTVQCSYCKQNHLTYLCKDFANLDVNNRVQHVQNERLCFNCLSSKHNVKNCKSRVSCHHCQKRHHSLLHFENKLAEERDNPVQSTSRATATNSNYASREETTAKPSDTPKMRNYLVTQSHTALMATALVNINTGHGIQLLRALIDPCSQESFISEATVKKLQLRRKTAAGLVTGVGHMSTRIKFATDIEVYSRFNDSFKVNCTAYIVQDVTDIMPEIPINPQKWSHLQHLSLADPTYHTPGNIDLVLGVHIYADILMNGVIKGEPGTPIAQQTRLGYILSGGQLNNNRMKEFKSMHLNITLEEMVEKFWETERLESEENDTLTPQELRAEKIYQETVTRDTNGRYIVALPFKSNKPTLPENSREIALRRFMSTERRLEANAKLRESYNEVMREYITLQHMELVNRDEPVREPDRRVYLSHHPVIREDRDTTKLRVVYDASCRGTNGVSLNSELLVGPSLLGDLRDILMRWRIHKVCFVADVIKMYRQILVRREDTDFQRILWRFSPDEDIREYRMLTVTFGTACAPFLAIKTLRQIAIDEANTEEYTQAREIINHSFYMDDVLSGGDTEENAIEAKRQLIEILRRGGFELQKWSSNNKEFMNTVEPEKRAKNSEIDINKKETIKTLGIIWNSNEDTLLVTNKINTLSEQRVTKRNVLTVIASLFDPMGWLAPSVVMAKIFLQKTWSRGLAWDTELPEDLKTEWKTFCRGLEHLSDVKLERWIGTSNKSELVELHGFADASMSAYAAVVYSRVIQSNGEVKVSLIMAKTKISSMKKQLTLPRLELSAALLLSQLLKHVATAMRIEHKNTYAYSDSKVTLAWILGDPLKWTTFVKNRVIAINNNIDTTWSYVNTKENPADPASRGVTPEKLKEHTLWFKGPTFLNQREWRREPCEIEDTDLETRKSIKCATTTVSEKKEDFILTISKRYSSLRKLISVIAYCRRWLILKNKDVKYNLCQYVTHDEREEALTICIKLSQQLEFPEEIEALRNHTTLKNRSRLLSLTPFLDDKEVLRVGGRLKHADLEFLSKHPIILSKNNVLVPLLLNDAHKKTLHGGPQLMTTYLRGRYWLIDAGNTIKTYVRNCFPCAKQKAKTVTQLMGDLPEIRVKPSRAFLTTGVDFAGPVNVRMSPGRGSKTFKAYISIFICMVTKAIHIECVSNMTMEAFMAAFRRFTSRRGFVKEMWSDHGTNFISSSKEILEMWRLGKSTIPVELAALLDTEGTKWKFIPPGSPNHGGLWEAGVKSIKFHLKRTLGDATPTFEEFTTLLNQVEACLNSRPLSPLSDHPDDLEPLTPAHFLVGEPLVTIPERDLTQHKTNSLSRWQNIQKMLQIFWRKWQTEFLTRLQERPKWKIRKQEFNVGDLVLIKDHRLPPSKWLLGRVLQKHPGQDNVTRVYDIRTATGVLTRSIPKLCPLPDVRRKDSVIL